MPDSGGVRSRRKRLHDANDHSECTSQCAAVRAEVDISDAEPVTDSKAELALLAGQILAAYRSDPMNAMLAKEARQALQQMGADTVPQSDDVDEIARSWKEGSDAV